eukprot:1821881-Pleurochrysis_carterae.AAC.2
MTSVRGPESPRHKEDAWVARSESGGWRYHWRPPWAADMRRPLLSASAPTLQALRQRQALTSRKQVG